MNITDLDVDLAGVFAAGHAYVALSRATSPETLELRGFDTEKVWAAKEVLEFYCAHVRHLDGTPSVPPEAVEQVRVSRRRFL